MTHTKQPEALRLAEFALKRQSRLGPCRECTGCQEDAWDGYTRTSKLLLEQHAAIEAKDARISELEAESRALKGELEAIGAGGVTGLRVNQNPFKPPPFERSGKAIAQEGGK